MEPILIIIIVAAVVLLGGLAFLFSRRGRQVEIESQGRGQVGGRQPGDTAVLEREAADDLSSNERAPGETVDVDPDDVLVEEPTASAEPDEVVKPSFFDRLGKARSAFTGYLGGLVGAGALDDEAWEDLEEALIRADVGVQTAMSLLEDVRSQAKEEGKEQGEEILGLLKTRMKAELTGKERALIIDEGKTNVWLFVGVNGVGKTTTIGKLGKRLVAEGHKPLMAAGDTFRAAAAEQLTMWAERSDVDIVRGNEGGDPASVIFDGIKAAEARDCDVVLADTAGRLQNKSNLMDELSKVRRVAAKEPGHVSEVLLVIDATTGQNGMTQAKVFAESVEVTGVVLTKLDGSAKGGIVFAIESELDLPVKLVGLGEGVDDLVDFDPDAFVDALFE